MGRGEERRVGRGERGEGGGKIGGRGGCVKGEGKTEGRGEERRKACNTANCVVH